MHERENMLITKKIMKNLLTTLNVFLKKSILIALCLFAFCSCGDDDSDGGEAQGAKGGKGRKIVRMAVTEIGEKGWPKEAYQSITVYTIKYDGDGRLIEIYRNDNETSQKVFEIDYDLMLVKANKIYVPFMTNKDGFISQFSNYQFTYNEGGYLKNITKLNNIWSFAYDNNYLTSFIEVFIDDSGLGMDYPHYCYYEDDNETGETHLYLEGPKNYTYRNNYGTNYYPDYQDICIILYQAEFFGHITKHFKNSTNSKAYNTSFEFKNDESDHYFVSYGHYPYDDTKFIHCFKYSFVFE